MITISGFSEMQKAVADDLWNLKTTDDVEQYILALPKALQPHARAVLDMIVAASLDEFALDTDTADSLINRIKQDSRKG